MEAKEAAAALDGNGYGEEGSRALFAEMKAAGLVAVFGASDDLMEFRGAIDEEVGAYDGTTAFVTPDGLLEGCDEECAHYSRAKERAVPIDAIWDRDGFSWVYDTAIPHEEFITFEDGEPYCRGIVFALADARPRPDPALRDAIAAALSPAPNPA